MSLEPTHPAVLAVLLNALADQQPCAKAPKWEQEGERGWARSWVECPKCKGSGETTWKGRTVKCDRLHCNGQGGWHGDPMAEMPFSRPITPNTDSDSSITAFTAHVLDMSCAELDRLDAAIDQSVNGTLERQARAQHPAFAHIDAALVVMRHASPYHRAVLVRRHFLGIPTTSHDVALYDDALHVLALTLGTGFHAPGWALKTADEQLRGERARKANGAGRHALNATQRQRRDQEVRRLAERGDKPSTIGRRLGLDRRTVERIIDKEAA